MQTSLVIYPLGFLATSLVSLFTLRGVLNSCLKREDISTIKWEAGDVVSCVMKGVWGPFDGEHFMLAVSNNSVIHLTKPAISFKAAYFNREGFIKEHTRERIMLKQNHCHNHGKKYDRPVAEVIEDARKYVNKEVQMHMVFCNCEHFINKVTKGYNGFSTTTLTWAYPWCHF